MLFPREMIYDSLADQDYYKFTMGQLVFHQFPSVEVEFEFVCRTKGINLAKYKKEIEEEIQHFCTLRFTNDEINFLSKNPLHKQDYLDFLKTYKPNYAHFTINTRGNDIIIKAKGPWKKVIYYEVPVLAIVNEVYFRNTYPNADFDGAKCLLIDKCENILDSNREILDFNPSDAFKLLEFGTRRRFSKKWQKEVTETLKEKLQLAGNLAGTSNVKLAMDLDIPYIGTQAHEYFMAMQALYPARDSQKMALENWIKEYRGKLAVALTDTLGSDAFVKDMDYFLAKVYDGVRHDSGDKQVWFDKMRNMFASHGIDPYMKKYVFSDGLTVDSALDFYYKNAELGFLLFGIGTSLTNDIPGVTPLNIVMKMTYCNGLPVAKISDDAGKAICKSQKFLDYLIETFGIGK